MLSALFYATNVYTLYVFTATWGYSSYQILYLFIPALTGLYMQSLETRKNLPMYLFFLITFLASSSFGNPAFALSLGIYFLLLTLFLFLFRFTKCDQDAIKRIVIITLGALFINAYWILPLVPQVGAGIQEVYVSEIVNLSERLQKTSNAIFDTIRLMPTSEQNRYFPINFPYFSLAWMKPGIILLAFVPFFMVLLGYSQKSTTGRERKVRGVFFALFIVFIALIARVRFPFDSINMFFFQLPGMNTLRGYDKLATFAPFLLSALIFMTLMTVYGKKYSRVILLGFLILTVTLALPFYAGGLQTKMSYILSSQKRKNFQEAKQSAIIKIPEPYYAASSLFQTDSGDYKLSMLPFSPGSSIGRVNFPVWKVNGPHIAGFLYSKPYVELTEPYITGWRFADDFTDPRYDPQWIIDLYGLIGIKYIFYHKDAKPSSVEGMEASRIYLENTGMIQSVENNKFFNLYQLSESKTFPYVYTTERQDVFIRSHPEGFSDKVQSFRKSISALRYERQNPKKILVDIDTLPEKAHIFLNEKNDSLWRAEYISLEGNRSILERDESVLYANAWKVNQGISKGKIEIYYSPLKLFYIGQILSGATLLFVIFGTVYTTLKRNSSQESGYAKH